VPRSAPTVKASVTFLTREEGGRSTPAIGSKTYMPHLVVGDPNQRVAITASDGRTAAEDYLGVRFTGTVDDILVPGRAHAVSLELCYFPSVDYTALKTGAQFTIREGGTVVGFGNVIEGNHLGAT
jgi:translation elongation factor EF-Tu-like GTPase